MRVNEVTYEKLKTPLKVNSNLKAGLSIDKNSFIFLLEKVRYK